MADIEFYKSTVDEWDESVNGGDITEDLIESGVAHSLMLPVRPATAENGGERWFKYYAKATVDTITLGFDVGKFSISPTENVYLSLAGSNDEVENDLDKDSVRLYGGFKVDDYDADNKKVTADRDVSDFVKADDKVTFYDADDAKLTSWEVESVDVTDITFKDTNDDDVAGLKASSTIERDTLNTDEYVGFWVKEVIPAFTAPMEDPLNEFILAVWYDVK